MKSFRFPFFLFLGILAVSLTGCDVIGDIFKAGAYVGIIGVLLVVLLLWWIVRKIGGRR